MLAGEERSHMSGEKCGYSRLSLKFFLGEIGFTKVAPKRKTKQKPMLKV